MRALIQRVSRAEVRVEGEITGAIGGGLLVLLGAEHDDTVEDAAWLASKICAMRIFGDEAGKMNLDLEQTGGGLLVVSQFTLHAATRKGNRPSFIRAARPEHAEPLYEALLAECRAKLGNEKVGCGIFGAMMEVELVNDGPVTIWMDSRQPE